MLRLNSRDPGFEKAFKRLVTDRRESGEVRGGLHRRIGAGIGAPFEHQALGVLVHLELLLAPPVFLPFLVGLGVQQRLDRGGIDVTDAVHRASQLVRRCSVEIWR